MSTMRPNSHWMLLGIAGICLLWVPGAFAAPAGDAAEAEVVPTSYVGTELCLECHEEGESFTATLHGRAHLAEWNGVEGCESCHGPGEAHAEEGDVELIRSFNDAAQYTANEACLSCHSGGDMANWHGSTHEAYDLTCTSCHEVHQPWTSDRMLAKQNETETCLSCHQEQR